MAIRSWQREKALFLILACAFLLRLTAGMIFFYRGAEIVRAERGNWWDQDYTDYGTMAINFVQGKGLVVDQFQAARVPLYSLLLAAEYRFFGRTTLAPIVAQSLLGAGTVFFAYLIANLLFGRREGLIAAILCMGYPYYVGHDTAQQENALMTFLMAAAVYFLFRARRSNSWLQYALGGSFLGLAILTRDALLVSVPFVLFWLAVSHGKEEKTRAAAGMAVVVIAVGLVLSPWLIRNARIYGQPLITAGEGNGLGSHLWIGFNGSTLLDYPWESIDNSTGDAYEKLPKAELEEVRKLGDIEIDRWFLQRALRFIREHPFTSLKYAAVKVFAGFSPVISPITGGFLRGFLYTISYTPVLVLAVWGGILAQRRWRTLSLIYFLILSFIAVTIGAHAHTSHRSYLDVYLIVLASYAINAKLFGVVDSPRRI